MQGINIKQFSVSADHLIIKQLGLRKIVRRNYYQLLQRLNKSDIDLELSVISANPRFKAGTTNIFGRPFKFHDGRSFTNTYRELFQSDIYKFTASNDARTILDCGANMGLSVLYFASNYPEHRIIAFEPDAEICNVLRENVETFELKNVTIHQKAVWNKKETLSFFTDRGMGGRVEQSYKDQKPVEIEAIPLSDFLTEDVDFLKIDIEGAEETVLTGCKDILYKANHIFFEYHNSIKEPQALHKMLELVSSQGFTYYIKESDVRKRPFIEEHIIVEIFDMALNIFCYKK